MLQIIAIAIGGALGALSRYGLVAWVTRHVEEHFPDVGSFPFGTLVVNILGSLLIGVCYVVVLDRLQLSPQWQAITMVGFLGAFTTFSTFSLETLVMLQDGRYVAALSYILLSVVVCVVAVLGGITLAKQLI